MNQFVKNFANQLETQNASAASTETTSTPSAGETVAGVAAEATEAVVEKAKAKINSAPPADNSFDGTSLIGTVVKSIFGGILDFFKGLFGGKK